ncbi:hypothetical protein BFC18_02925 [Alteromonas confluentis]|uniref:Enamine deaminase RidA n=1 Tax=Alteromonas confluentis TaxID=1656094 RepID=A0A1E7ZGF0_9ALTE|nr:hypothetical protein BFC18_02925 [Alteromonas confluentis]
MSVFAASGPVYFPKSSGAAYSKAVQVDNTLYISGLLGMGKGGFSDDFNTQMTQLMANLSSTLSDFNLTSADVFKCTVMIDDMANWAAFNKIYVSFFEPDRLPARSAFGSDGLPANALVELECLAYMPAKG